MFQQAAPATFKLLGALRPMPQAGLSPRILIVDDDRIIREVVECVLSTWLEGAEIVKAIDGQSGLELVRLDDFDLIVTDVRMPRLSGIEMLKEVRRGNIDTPAVIFSSSEIEMRESSALGAFAYLPKVDVMRLPVVAGELLKRSGTQGQGDRS